MAQLAMQNTAFFTFLSGPNGEFVQGLYDQYQQDPTGLDPSWVALFDGLSADDRALLHDRAQGATDALGGVKNIAGSGTPTDPQRGHAVPIPVSPQGQAQPQPHQPQPNAHQPQGGQPTAIQKQGSGGSTKQVSPGGIRSLFVPVSVSQPASIGAPVGVVSSAPPPVSTPMPTPAPAPHTPTYMPERLTDPVPRTPTGDPSPVAVAGVDQGIERSLMAFRLVEAYRMFGHGLANLDPLGIIVPDMPPILDPKTYGFHDLQDETPIYLGGVLGFDRAPIGVLFTRLCQIYCGSIGFEYRGVLTEPERRFLEERIERDRRPLSPENRQALLKSLSYAALFEKFLSVKYPGAKRFGLEGGESTIPVLETLLAASSAHGIREVALGMAHRGRLNVLANVIGKAPRAIFAEFQGTSSPDLMHGSGDVKYHLGASNDRKFGDAIVHVSLTANPSHLEAVNPVVMGKVRAKQQKRGDQGDDQVLGILIHGDAAFAGQGVVTETLMLSGLPGYRTGGTIHVITNNQIGFTTDARYGRSSPYCSDGAKGIGAPVFHVNGDDPEAAVFVARLAADYRRAFKKDVVIDLYCYRRNGHNEMDEPNFTQPLMYQKIKAQKPIHEKYAHHLIADGITIPSEVAATVASIESYFSQEFDGAQTYAPHGADWLQGAWSGLEGVDKTDGVSDGAATLETGVSLDILREIGDGLGAYPDGFTPHAKLLKLLETRQAMGRGEASIDWAGAEAFAFASLLLDGVRVRLSGQDSGRGTFSQRHAVLTDQQTGARHIPMNGIRVVQEEIEIVDSPLSEAAVLGFEYGYSLSDPNALTLWEAQFGDFANGAQVMIDQFIVSGAAKWLRLSGLVLLLPHGYEGQGPEHSSARLERFLQLAAEENIQVMNLTTPAGYFHALRRQIYRKTRRPLVIMTPKSLLRHRLAVSSLDDMAPNTRFEPVLVSQRSKKDKDITRVLLCSGKIYYDLDQEREKNDRSDVAIVRLEQLYPFPSLALTSVLLRYPKAQVIWCQEEHANMGAWSFVDRRIEGVLSAVRGKSTRPIYVGRAEAAATATGSHHRHETELAQILGQAFDGKIG